LQQADDKGQLALHVLGNNSKLLNYPEGQRLARKCAVYLMELYPNAIVITDHDGHMPFTYLIQKWVEWTFLQDPAIGKGNKKDTN
jgi:hypothetical protein